MQFRIDDGSGLRVADAEFLGETKFEWDLFSSYDTIRILTYSAGISAIVRLLEKHDFKNFECVFGSEKTLHNIKDIIAFQQVAVSDSRAAIQGLTDERHIYILSKIRERQAHFRVLQKGIAHSKIYLLENTTTDDTRVIIGSANLSENAFSGRQSETLVKFDNDLAAWQHYSRMYDEIRNNASIEIELPAERITEAKIELHEVPALNPKDLSNLVIDSPQSPDTLAIAVPTQEDRIETLKAAIPPEVSAVLPAFRNGKQNITYEIMQKVRRVTSRLRIVKRDGDVNSRYLSIDHMTGKAELSDAPFSLEYDQASVVKDARLMVNYFKNYEDAFEGDVPRLQRDYFMLWSWLYFSPLMCDARTLADAYGDIFRYPSFAIIYGKSGCGKSSLVDTLITSMFGREYRVDKSEFTGAKLRALQTNYKRFPVVFDDIGKRAMNNYGIDIIKNENHPGVEEYPCFIVSMNKEMRGFSDEIIKRCMMIYTETALPIYKFDMMNKLQVHIQDVRRDMTGHLYKRYLSQAINELKDNRLTEDWLEFSSKILTDIVVSHIDEPAPDWLRPATWNEYASKRHDNVKAQLTHLLRPSARIKNESSAQSGYVLEKDKVIVVEQTDTFGRRPFDWENVPSTLIDENASVAGRTVLHRTELENDFLGFSLDGETRWLGRMMKALNNRN